jgi:ubiquinone/menaquinone biosynthesis C-methylase UbiE
MPSLLLDTPELAATYDDVSDKQFAHGKLLLAALALKPGERVLDIGCGTGRLGAYAASDLVGPTGSVDGVDPLDHRIAIARRRASPNHRVAVAGSEDLGLFADATFDAVWLNSVYHWLPRKQPTLREARRVLKPGGRIGISVASRERPHDQHVVLKEVLRAQGVPGPKGSAPHKVTAAQLARQLEDAGFLVDEIRLRTFTDVFPDAQAVIAFNRSSSFGNFLDEHAPATRELLLAAFAEALERRRAADGIVLRRNLLFAVASVPAARP